MVCSMCGKAMNPDSKYCAECRVAAETAFCSHLTTTSGGSGRKLRFAAKARILALLLLIVIGSAALAVRRTEKSALASEENNSAVPVGGASTEKAGTAQTVAELPASGTNAISAPISGTYRMKGSTVNVADSGQTQEQSREGELELVEQTGGKLNFALEADLVVDESNGDVHTGELTGEVEIRNGEAVFAYNRGKYDQCRITMKFTPDNVELEQTQECGFGTGVDASGTYAKISSEVPHLPREQ
jgi:hypothetical protein